MDVEWQDKVEYLPDGSMMIVRHIREALGGGDIRYFEKTGTKATIVAGVPKEEWSYYFSVFHNCEEFGLPHGRGWLHELPWVPHFLIQMRYFKRLIECDMQEKAIKRNKVSNGR